MQRDIASTRQRGAALAVGLILLLVITLLALSGMSSASLELMMAGNEQFRQDAFQAAEAGIADTIATGSFNPSDESLQRTAIAISGSTATFDSRLTPELDGRAQPAIWGNRWDSFATYHFEVQSVGHGGARNAMATNMQGIAVLAPWDSSIPPDSSLGTALCATPPCP